MPPCSFPNPSGSRHLASGTILIPLLAAGLLGCASRNAPPASRTLPGGQLPRQYTVPYAHSPVVVDGRLNEGAWKDAPWSEAFTDIEGSSRPAPPLLTRMRMTWDATHWYIAAEMLEPDLWATIRERDAVIFRDNDFELFVDPQGRSRRYFEVEMNQFGTIWDLFLPKAYRDGGHAVNGWNIAGLQIAVKLNGSINHPGDRDRGWTVELAIPWAAFADSGQNVVPPRPGDRWRVNFSRVEWDVDAVSGSYHKRSDAAGKPLPEHNWVWSPQGVINMHVPEQWGVVHFAGKGSR